MWNEVLAKGGEKQVCHTCFPHFVILRSSDGSAAVFKAEQCCRGIPLKGVGMSLCFYHSLCVLT